MRVDLLEDLAARRVYKLERADKGFFIKDATNATLLFRGLKVLK